MIVVATVLAVVGPLASSSFTAFGFAYLSRQLSVVMGEFDYQSTRMVREGLRIC